MTRESKPLRGAFYEQLRSKFFDSLRGYGPTSQWDTAALWLLTGYVLGVKGDEINKYLDENKITLLEADHAIQVIVHKILLPEVGRVEI